MSVQIRVATIDDIDALAQIHVEGWQGAYGGLIDQAYINSQTVEKRTADWMGWLEQDDTHHLIAHDDDKATGFCGFGPLRTAPPGTSKIRPQYSSEIYGLYLKPEYFRKGVGTALMKEAAKNLKDLKHQSTCLWVLKDNKRGCAFYDAMGGQRIGKKIEQFGPTKAKEVCYGWRDITEILDK